MAHFDISKHVNAFLPQSAQRDGGSYAPNFRTLDGSDVAAWLRCNGYTVTGYKDTGRNGLAITECGYAVSTNGYVCRAEDLPPIIKQSDIMPEATQAKILSDLWFIGQINEVIQKVKAKRSLHHLVYMNIVRVSDVDGKMFLSNTGA